MENKLITPEYLRYISTTKITKPIFRVEILNKFNDTIEKSINGYVENNSGKITISNTDGMRRTCSLTLRNYSNEFTEYFDGISLGERFKVYLGYDMGSSQVLFPQGVFIYSNPSLTSDTARKVVNVDGSDKWSLISGECGGILQGTYQVKKGTSLGEFVKNTLALDIVGDYTPPNIDESVFDAKTTYDIVHEAGETIADVVLEVAMNLSCNVYYDENGVFTMTPFVYDTERPSIYSFHENDINYISGKKTYQLDGVYNAVLVVSDNMQNDSTPIRSYLENTDLSDENSPLNGTPLKIYIPNNYLEGIDTQEKADARARYELKIVTAMQSTVSIESKALYHFVENNIVTITDPHLNCDNERFLISGISFDIGSNGGMSLDVVKARKYL